MNEVGWLACEDPESLHQWVGTMASERRLRLCAVAVHRCVMGGVDAGPLRRAVTLAERYADGLTDASRLRASELAARVEALSGDWMTTVSASAYQLAGNPFDTSRAALHLMMAVRYADITLKRAAADLLRDIFGNPFRPVDCSPEWRTDTVITLARQMYASRDFSAMPILADALQDAGCGSEEILNHCRDPKQTHVRGCWVVDLVLGKS